MNYFWLDANAIVKQYVTEKRGTPLINYFFTRVSLNRILCLFDSMDEARFAFVRKKNKQIISVVAFNQVIQRFEGGFLQRTDVEQVTSD